jgi:hypothetical protein
LALLATAAVACAADPQAGDADRPAPAVEAAETALAAPASTAPAAPTAAPAPAVPSRRRNDPPAPSAAAATPAPAAPAIPLEKLLQLPADGASDPVMEALLRSASPKPAGEKTAARKLRIDLGLRTDSPIERRDLKLEQADAAAAVDIGSDTTLRGGVRVERESNGGKASTRTPAPTIGLEKRF